NSEWNGICYWLAVERMEIVFGSAGEQRMSLVPKRWLVTVLFSTLAMFAAVAGASTARAEAKPGKYRCIKLEAGDQVYPCQSPTLTLKSDGSYQIWGENGTYEVMQDRWLVLSHSKRRGLGYLEKSGEIIFEYKAGKKVCRVTFQRI